MVNELKYVDPNKIYDILLRRNLILIAPTGSGKTHGIVVASRKLLETGTFKKVIITEPSRAAVGEVVRKVTKLIGEGVIGRDDSDARLEPNWKMSEVWRKPVIATTYERLDSVLISSASEIVKDTLFVIDEAHQLTDENRATTLVNVLAYLKMYNARVALLSATMPEVKELSEYLSAEVYSLTERPVKVEVDEVPVSYNIRSFKGASWYYHFKIKALVEYLEKNKQNIADIAPVYIYVPSRKWSERVANELKRIMDDKGIKVNIVYHHAGLPHQKRREIENEIIKKNPKIHVVVATDTLSHAVNASFKTVVIMGITRFTPSGLEIQKPEIIKQAMGRAGRPGYYDTGKVIILYTPFEIMNVSDALRGIYHGVEQPNDYLALVLRLIYTKRDPEVWAKYAYKIDKEKISYSMDIGREIGLITGEQGNYKLSLLGRVVAKEYLPSEAIPPLLMIDEGPFGKVLEDMERYRFEDWEITYYLASLLSFYTSKLWRIEGDLKRLAITDTVSVDLNNWMVGMMNKVNFIVLSGLTYDEETKLNRILDKVDLLKQVVPGLVELGRNEQYKGVGGFILSGGVLSVFGVQESGHVDSIAESVRKSSQVLENYIKEAILSGRQYNPQLVNTSRGLAVLMRAYRIALKKIPDYATKLFHDALPLIGLIGERQVRPHQLVNMYVRTIAEEKQLEETINETRKGERMRNKKASYQPS